MTNLTLSIPDDTLARVRVYAAERKTTVNALIRKHMEDLVDTTARRQELIDEVLALGANTKARFDMSSWNREDTYDRHKR